MLDKRSKRAIRCGRITLVGIGILTAVLWSCNHEHRRPAPAPTFVTVNDLIACGKGHSALDPERHIREMSAGEDGFIATLWHDGGAEPGWENYYVYVTSDELVYHQPKELATTHILRVPEGRRVECRGAMFISRTDVVPSQLERIPIVGTFGIRFTY